MTNSEALKLKPLIDEVEFEYVAPGGQQCRGLVLGLHKNDSGDIIVNILYEDEDDGFSRKWNCGYLKKV